MILGWRLTWLSAELHQTLQGKLALLLAVRPLQDTEVDGGEEHFQLDLGRGLGRGVRVRVRLSYGGEWR